MSRYRERSLRMEDANAWSTGRHIYYGNCARIPRYWCTRLTPHLLCILESSLDASVKGVTLQKGGSFMERGNMIHHAPTFWHIYWWKVSELISGIKLDKSVQTCAKVIIKHER